MAGSRLISTGPQTGRVLAAAELLAESGIDASVIHVPSIKPIDESALVDAVTGADLVVTVEEHSVYGGLGGLVAEILTAAGPAPQIERIGVDDTWGESAGNDFMLDKHGLSPEKIAARVQTVFSVATDELSHPRDTGRWLRPVVVFVSDIGRRFGVGPRPSPGGRRCWPRAAVAANRSRQP